MENNNVFTNIDEYIQQSPLEIQPKLQALRETIRSTAPDAFEKISYQMPTFDLHGNLVHFAYFKNHIGFYPSPSGIEAFKHEFANYSFSKGAVQFPIDQELPLDLVSRIVSFRVEENINEYQLKQARKKSKLKVE